LSVESGEIKVKDLPVKAVDGISIHAKLFCGVGALKAVIIVCHGFSESIGGYREVARFFVENGCACAVFDQRGHGETVEKRGRKGKPSYGVIPNYGSLLSDISSIKDLLKHAYPNVPLVLYGHSMGGNIAASYLIKVNQNDFACAVLETPWLRLYKPKPSAIVWLANILGGINPRFAIINKLKPEDIARDVKKNNEPGEDKYNHCRISLRLFAGITAAGEFAIENAGKLTIPVLLACAGNDLIVCPKAIREMGGKSNANVEFVEYRNAYHAIHNDIDSEKFLRDMMNFIDRLILPQAPTPTKGTQGSRA